MSRAAAAAAAASTHACTELLNGLVKHKPNKVTADAVWMAAADLTFRIFQS